MKSHLQNLYQKLGVSDRTAAVAEALRRGRPYSDAMTPDAALAELRACVARMLRTHDLGREAALL